MSDDERLKEDWQEWHRRFCDALEATCGDRTATLDAALKIRKRIRDLEEQQRLSVGDYIEDDLAIRSLAEPILGPEATYGDSIAVPSVVEIMERLRSSLEGRDKAIELLNKGFESACADRDRMKQRIRELEEERGR